MSLTTRGFECICGIMPFLRENSDRCKHKQYHKGQLHKINLRQILIFMYYLYKLSLSGTPKYYVGVTNNPVTRQAGHISAINESIRSLRSGKDLLGEAYHIVIAKHILSVEKKKYRQDPIFFVSFKVVLEAGETLEKAISAE